MTISSLKIYYCFATFMKEIFAKKICGERGLSAKFLGFAGIQFGGHCENLISQEYIFPKFKIHLRKLVLQIINSKQTLKKRISLFH